MRPGSFTASISPLCADIKMFTVNVLIIAVKKTPHVKGKDKTKTPLQRRVHHRSRHRTQQQHQQQHRYSQIASSNRYENLGTRITTNLVNSRRCEVLEAIILPVWTSGPSFPHVIPGTTENHTHHFDRQRIELKKIGMFTPFKKALSCGSPLHGRSRLNEIQPPWRWRCDHRETHEIKYPPAMSLVNISIVCSIST